MADELSSLPTQRQPSKPRSFRQYKGRIWYDFQGHPIEETGFQNEEEADKRIERTEKVLRGRWCFAVEKTMTQDRRDTPEVWVNLLMFPDGKKRKLKQGELPTDQPGIVRQGQWITQQQIATLYRDVRVAPGSRFPWKKGTAYVTQHRWDSMLDFEQFLKSCTGTIFILPTTDLPPIEPGVYAYICHAA